MTTTPFRRPAARRVARAATVVALAAATVLGATGCGGGSTDEPGGLDISSGSRHLKLVAYAVPKPGFDKIIPAFRATPQGHDIGFSQSYGASGDQSRKVARRVPADVVNFSVEPDITRLVKEGVVDEDWKSQAPNNSTPFGSVVALVVRKGNPKNIRDWDDLLKPGVQVITPNPGSSGSAKWNLLAPFAAKSDGGRNPQAGLDYIAEQVFNLTFMSWRSFMPSYQPVSVSYPNMVVKLLGNLRQIPNFNPDILITRLRESRWFL